MKNADESINGLARVDTSTPSTPAVTPPRRNMPMKRVDIRPATQQLTPSVVGGTDAIKAELESALMPVLQEIADSEYNTAANVVNSLIPRVILARSAQSESKIAAHVRSIAGEVAIESLSTFPGVFASSEIIVNSMADALFDELLAV